MFGRGKRGKHHAGRSRGETPVVEEAVVAEEEPAIGPFDLAEAPDDGIGRLDLGSVRLPVPDGAQLQVEMDPSGPVRAVHILTPIGRLTVSAFAAPRSGGLWAEVSDELADQLRGDGATVAREDGTWGDELAAVTGEVSLRFVGVDGPRWMVRGVAASPPEHVEPIAELLRALLAGTVVVRGDSPMPVRTPLPVELPEEIAAHIQQAQGGQAEG